MIQLVCHRGSPPFPFSPLRFITNILVLEKSLPNQTKPPLPPLSPCRFKDHYIQRGMPWTKKLNATLCGFQEYYEDLIKLYRPWMRVGSSVMYFKFRKEKKQGIETPFSDLDPWNVAQKATGEHLNGRSGAKQLDKQNSETV